jgi:hypothetical protein
MVDADFVKSKIKARHAKEKMDLAESTFLSAKKDWEESVRVYLNQCKRLGLCPACEKHKTNCKCVGYAG